MPWGQVKHCDSDTKVRLQYQQTQITKYYHFLSLGRVCHQQRCCCLSELYEFCIYKIEAEERDLFSSNNVGESTDCYQRKDSSSCFRFKGKRFMRSTETTWLFLAITHYDTIAPCSCHDYSIDWCLHWTPCNSASSQLRPLLVKVMN